MNKIGRILFVQIPEVPENGSFTFHPISRSPTPQRYKPTDLRDAGVAQTEWVTFFEEILLGLYWKYQEPVPYVFRTADDTVRSLDAGCLKWLFNRVPPEVQFGFDRNGFIDTVTPTPALQQRYEARRDALVARLSSQRTKAR